VPRAASPARRLRPSRPQVSIFPERCPPPIPFPLPLALPYARCLSGIVATSRRPEKFLGPPPRLNPLGQKRLRVQRGVLGHCRAPNPRHTAPVRRPASAAERGPRRESAVIRARTRPAPSCKHRARAASASSSASPDKSAESGLSGTPGTAAFAAARAELNTPSSFLVPPCDGGGRSYECRRTAPARQAPEDLARCGALAARENRVRAAIKGSWGCRGCAWRAGSYSPRLRSRLPIAAPSSRPRLSRPVPPRAPRVPGRSPCARASQRQSVASA
jgi:hypothetical protein